MAGKWKRRRWMRGDGRKKLLVIGLSAAVLVLAVFGTGNAGRPAAAQEREKTEAPGTLGERWGETVKAGVHASSVLYACGELWFPAAFDSMKTKAEEGRGSRRAGLSHVLAVQLMEELPWYAAAEKGKQDKWNETDPAYRIYKQKQGQLEEYIRLAECLSSSQILADSGLIAGDGTAGWNPAALQSAGFDITAGQEDRKKEDAAEKHFASPVLPLPAVMGTPAGRDLLERAGLPVTGKTYLTEQLADYDYVMKHFYTVHPTAAAGRDLIQAEEFLARDFSLKQETDSAKPQILIYHSHSQEEFSDYHMGNREATIVGAGEYLAQLLKEKGYQVIHDTSVYDLRDGKLDRNKAYTYALKGVEKLLEEYPSIEVVLDIHRDGVGNSTRLVNEVNGKTTAQVMFFNGTSQTPDGPISYLENPNREDNLAFSFQMKLCADAFYPGYARNIYLKGLRYNLHLRPRSALVEVGAQTNTYEEARNAMEPLAEILDAVLGSRA